MFFYILERYFMFDSLMEESFIELMIMKIREVVFFFKVVVVGGIGYGKSLVINIVMGEDKCVVGVIWVVDKIIILEV